jgi:RNA-directed DNA polymerase
MQNSTRPVTMTGHGMGLRDGGYASFMTPGHEPGHIGMTGYALFLQGDPLGPRNMATIEEAKRVLGVLGQRLGRYGLTLHPTKTRLVDFRYRRPGGQCHSDADGTTFDFLGFTHVWGKTWQGKTRVWQVTAKSRYARALAAVSEWCRRNRHLPMRYQHAHLSRMMRGHYAYYGISGNSRRIRWFAWQVVRVWRKWLSRRDRTGVFLWSRLNALLKRHPLPPARIVHRYDAAASKAHP